jgi:predicted nucleotide-binding protein (sugar kinase/HSP70/actin superfamily)
MEEGGNLMPLEKITFPHMGNLYVGFTGLFGELDYDVIVPPKITQRTITKGSQHSPESMCVPFKYVIGSFLEVLESDGADTVFMAGGIGPCRFGLYGHTAKLILHKIGYDPRFVIVEPPAGRWLKFMFEILKLAHWKYNKVLPAMRWGTAKMELTDWIEEELYMKRIAYEPKRRMSEQIYRKYVELVYNADSYETLDKIKKDAIDEFGSVMPIDPDRDDVIDIELTGEIFILLEPYANMEIVRRLGEMGVRVSRTSSSTKWIKERVLTFLSEKGVEKSHERAIRKAYPWMKVPFGGEGIETIGHTVEAAEKGMDGIIQVMPFSCMPEVSAKDILPEVAKAVGIPFYSFIFDEHAGEAGFQTRLESFIERAKERKRRKLKAEKILVTVNQ